MISHGITRSHVAALASGKDQPVVSIYIPTSRTGVDVLQGHIRLKNFLVVAEERLVDKGMRRTVAKQLLAPAAELVDDVDFWNDRLDSVAIFIGPNSFQVFHLPFPTPAQLQVGTANLITPLLPVLTKQWDFQVLALEKNHVRLVDCHGDKAAEVAVPDMPTNFEAFISSEHAEKLLGLHSAGPSGRGGSVISHGMEDKAVLDKDRTHRFCLAIEHAVRRHLAKSTDPVVLAGTADFQQAYRDINKSPHLLAKGIVCSPKTLEPKELRDLAAPIVDEDADRERVRAIERYRELAGTGLTSQQIEEILAASCQGRVDILLAPTESMVWGKFDYESGTSVLHSDPTAGDEDMVNQAAIATIRNRGTAYTVAPEELPLADSAAAIFRY
ncbi:MAG TPA: hypothetical protein VHE55_19925 [Fimbriimonadaceae bacterium]|nr:hypothetical protein [Fimbriimonadaceae bacterium]